MPRWGKRLRDGEKTEVRIRFNRQREIIYAVDDAARADFAEADNEAIIAELAITEKGLAATPAYAANDAGSETPANVQGLAEALVESSPGQPWRQKRIGNPTAGNNSVDA